MGTGLGHHNSSSITVLHHLPLLGGTMQRLFKRKDIWANRCVLAGMDTPATAGGSHRTPHPFPPISKQITTLSRSRSQERQRRGWLYRTGTRRLRPRSPSARRTATRWRCSSRSDRRSGLPRTSGRGKLGDETKSHDSSPEVKLVTFCPPVTPKTKITRAIKDAWLQR